MAETNRDGDLSRRGFLVAAGVAALGLASLRAQTERREPLRPGPAREAPRPRQAQIPPFSPGAAREGGRLRARVTQACVACVLCSQTCPEVFMLGGPSARVIVSEVPVGAEERCWQAAMLCPRGAIVVEKV
jgi:ferredoxin